MQPSIPIQSMLRIPASAARQLGPRSEPPLLLPDRPSPLPDIAPNASLTPAATQGTERLASADESASRRLSAVSFVLPGAEDRDAVGAQLSP